MKGIATISLVMCMGLLSFLGNAFQKNENMPIKMKEESLQTTEQDLTFKGEYIFLQELLNCDEAHAVVIADTFTEVTGQPLERAELIPDEKKTRLLKVYSREHNYYLRITAGNKVREIREDTKSGKILYQIIY